MGDQARLANAELVPCSVTGRHWRLSQYDESMAAAMMQRYDVPDIVAQVLAARGIALDAVPNFLDPHLRDNLPDPAHLLDMDKATERLGRAILSGEKIAVFGDYDVDGATSTAVLVRFLRSVGNDPIFYIPDRIEEGYGPNAPAFLKLGAQGAKIIVTVDCGVMAHEPIQAASDAGMDVVVIDHHAAELSLPAATAIVNPNRLDETSPCRHLAAVGVVFLVCVSLNRWLRQQGFYQSRPEPDLLQWLDLVALGTVCDVVPLTGLNRAFVAQGLKIMAGRRNAGLSVLADLVQLDHAPTAFHASHVFGPRINAGGRIGQGILGARLLISDDKAEARDIAAQLDALNNDRKILESNAFNEALDILDAEYKDKEMHGVVFVVGEHWHQGVIGIVASRLKEKLNLPIIVATREGGHVKGSGRSVTGVDLGAAVIAARQAGLLKSGGGHPMAAGLTTTDELLPQAKQFIENHIAQQMENRSTEIVLDLSGRLAVSGVNADLMAVLNKMAPFGAGNPEPIFCVMHALIQKPNIFGTDHVRCYISSGMGGSLKGVAYRCAGDALGKALLAASGSALHLAGKLRINRWQGRETIEFLIEDAAPAWG